MKRASLKENLDLHDLPSTMQVYQGFCHSSKKLFIILFLSSISVITWQCSKNLDQSTKSNTSLKESLNANTQSINKALADIEQSEGYKIINLNAGNNQKVSHATVYQDSITLNEISGTYEYQPSVLNSWCFNCLYKLFTKTGPSNQFIVKLPKEKVFHPLSLALYTKADTSLKNDFVITTTDYHYYFTNGFLYDYRLAAGLSVEDTIIGGLDVRSTRASNTSYSYQSDFTFPNAYEIKTNLTSGDTITSGFTLSNGSGSLLAETLKKIKTSTSNFRERQYTLEIGNVKFTRSSSDDTVRVYLNNVIQKNAKIEVIDKGDSTTIYGSRDVKITYDDGTSVMLSDLLSPSLTSLRNLVGSMEDLFFASHIVDYIAINIHRTPK